MANIVNIQSTTTKFLYHVDSILVYQINPWILVSSQIDSTHCWIFGGSFSKLLEKIVSELCKIVPTYLIHCINKCTEFSLPYYILKRGFVGNFFSLPLGSSGFFPQRDLSYISVGNTPSGNTLLLAMIYKAGLNSR